VVRVTQGDIYWYDFAEPRGSEPGYERPVVIIQGDAFNRSRLDTAVCVVLSTNTKQAGMPGNVLLQKQGTGLDRDSVANVSQLQTVDRAFLRDHSGRIPPPKLDAILRGIDTMLGR
jgi:mRNA interferase MazF